MTIGPQDLVGQPKTEISISEALSMAWAKNGQLMFQIDILTQQLRAFESENKQLKAKLAELEKSSEEKKE